MRITLINPPSPFLIDQKAFPPLGILYLASVLENADYNVEIVDLAGKEEIMEQELKSCNSELYFVTATTPQYPYAKEIKNILNLYNPTSKVVIGGAHASSIPAKCLEDGFDVVVVGEGENAVIRIVNDYLETGSIDRIIKMPYIENIDLIPFPVRHLIDIKSYGYNLENNKATTLITSRGCPFECAFCSKDVWKRGTRYHSPEYVIKEIEEIYQKYNFQSIQFLDDSFTLNKKRLFKILDFLKNMNLEWRCYIRAKGTTKDILRKMKDSGCIEVGIGIESGSQKILDIVNKKTNVKENLNVVRNCKDVGIRVNTFIMIGLPGENYETVEETKKWMEEANPDKFGFNIFAPYIGTPVYKNPENYDIKLHEMSDEKSWVKGRKGEYESFVSTSALSREEILRLFTELFEYYTTLTGWQPGVGQKPLKI